MRATPKRKTATSFHFLAAYVKVAKKAKTNRPPDRWWWSPNFSVASITIVGITLAAIVELAAVTAHQY